MAGLSDEERENLVAYLDGELDEATAHQLETRLNLDPEARAEADAMQQTWGLLDYLPRPEPSASFTHRTLERLAVQTRPLNRRRVPRWLLATGWAAAVLVALLGGIGAAGLLWPAPQPRDDSDFIRALNHPDLFGDEAQPVEPPADQLVQVRLRYAEWLERLEPSERGQIELAADRETRVKAIRELREQEWLHRQPKKFREELVYLQGEQRTRRISQRRQEERRHRRDWQIAARFWPELQAGKPMEAKLSAFPNEVQVFVTEYLRPTLSPQEKERLDKAEGQWPRFPQTLVELADAHPLALLNPESGPTSLRELPKDVQRILHVGPSKKGGKREFARELYEAQGRWPTFAIVVARFARNKKLAPFPNELWPNNLPGLSKDTRAFVTGHLVPALDEAEKKALAKAAERGWPDYPRILNELARAHHLEIPWQTLPEPRKWDRYRTKKITPE